MRRVGSINLPLSSTLPNLDMNRPLTVQERTPCVQDRLPTGLDRPSSRQDRPPSGQDRPPSGQDRPPSMQDRLPIEQDHLPSTQDLMLSRHGAEEEALVEEYNGYDRCFKKKYYGNELRTKNDLLSSSNKGFNYSGGVDKSPELNGVSVPTTFALSRAVFSIAGCRQVPVPLAVSRLVGDSQMVSSVSSVAPPSIVFCRVPQNNLIAARPQVNPGLVVRSLDTSQQAQVVRIPGSGTNQKPTFQLLRSRLQSQDGAERIVYRASPLVRPIFVGLYPPATFGGPPSFTPPLENEPQAIRHISCQSTFGNVNTSGLQSIRMQMSSNISTSATNSVKLSSDGNLRMTGRPIIIKK
jgi:hypothetical protein